MRRVLIAVVLLVAGCGTAESPAPAPPPVAAADLLAKVGAALADPCAQRASGPDGISDPWTCEDYVGRVSDLVAAMSTVPGDTEYARQAERLRAEVAAYADNRCGDPGTPSVDECGVALANIGESLGFVRDEATARAGTVVEPEPTE
ncbi:hypothetical protein V5P93_005893 [Actinokineospora auranticolor]|uniref:Secreted protein n=1 Tax=Actinokineospora auranticolor TaxID=155976 RepID=A0A2S6GHM4_9PSEU|nr:hypothetical protein [Actinokineospora auranticolor]PPK64717.1 hypothetical protein CLV40_118107 [Actinokineospora auranticolor]